MVAIMIGEQKIKSAIFKKLDNRQGVEEDQACSTKNFIIRILYKAGMVDLGNLINWATTDFYGSNDDLRVKFFKSAILKKLDNRQGVEQDRTFSAKKSTLEYCTRLER